MTSGAATGQAYLKTGTLSDTRALAGYVRAKSGRVYAVSMIVTDPEAAKGTPALDSLVEWIAPRGCTCAAAYRLRAKSAEHRCRKSLPPRRSGRSRPPLTAFAAARKALQPARLTYVLASDEHDQPAPTPVARHGRERALEFVQRAGFVRANLHAERGASHSAMMALESRTRGTASGLTRMPTRRAPGTSSRTSCRRLATISWPSR